MTPPVAEHVYQTEQSGVRGAKKKLPNNLQMSPDVPLDELYSKPNKQRKPRNDLEIKNIYAEVKPRNTEQQVDSRETPGDDDVIMSKPANDSEDYDNVWAVRGVEGLGEWKDWEEWMGLGGVEGLGEGWVEWSGWVNGGAGRVEGLGEWRGGWESEGVGRVEGLGEWRG
ncbi:hypothetical protein NP493_144g05052 [Ridgeia piscesae]|uniref:Uncharacterized protein n=1 Tax=Ridgeia piscesae TaxID=27915 RepID=A0AAD9P4P1_RIDPI|nr:hypothetical protein NP493_144g05052 [Ridgeia piscesae]